VLANTVGKLTEKLVALELQKHCELWHERAFAGRRGRGAIDSVMLMAMIAEKHPEGDVIGRDAQSAFNTVRREHVWQDHEGLKNWIYDWLALRRFEVTVDGNTISTTRMTAGTPQGSPLSPSLYTVYMSSVVWATERKLAQRGGGRLLRRKKRESYWPLSYIGGISGARVGGEKEMDEALEEAAQTAGIRWDRSKDWKSSKGKHLGRPTTAPKIPCPEGKGGLRG